ncbi:hypothetical protein [Streptomyces sp. NPDC096105]|uniref:hypothetical protein n=1 Tax=Streptomyces sp. NPDC096105 TaxID=3366074 RepID=UPI0038288CE2
MSEHELYRLRHDDLVRRAAEERRVREAMRARRAARHVSGARGGAESHTWRRSRSARTA